MTATGIISISTTSSKLSNWLCNVFQTLLNQTKLTLISTQYYKQKHHMLIQSIYTFENGTMMSDLFANKILEYILSIAANKDHIERDYFLLLKSETTFIDITIREKLTISESHVEFSEKNKFDYYPDVPLSTFIKAGD